VAADDPVVDGACDWNEAWSGEEDDGAEDDAAAAGKNDSRPPRLKVHTGSFSSEVTRLQAAAVVVVAVVSRLLL